MNKTRIAAIVGAVTFGAALIGCLSGGTPESASTPVASKAVDIAKGAIPATRGAGPAPTAKPTTKAPVSAEQSNATRAAEEYLDGQSFSRKGLIDQLKYEGYSTKAATAAVDSLHVDWNNQAVLVAKDYLSGQSFSRKSLISQLEFDGFSHDQAVHGVTGAGL